MTQSAIYHGTLSHRRAEPERGFEHRIAMYYVDLDELPRLLGGRLAAARPGILRFRRRDYHGPERGSLSAAVRESVQLSTGHRPQGPVRVLTMLRTFGYCFNPVSFYYCFAPDGQTLEAVLAEVTNTPWKERHAYVIPGGEAMLDKQLHVSPFFGMDHVYRCRLPAPGTSLTASIDNFKDGRQLFGAALSLDRVELTAEHVRQMTRRYPFGSVRVLALIYAHAVGIRLAGVKTFPHRRPLAPTSGEQR